MTEDLDSDDEDETDEEKEDTREVDGCRDVAEG